MARERPIEPPRALPDAARGKRLKPHQERECEEIRRLGAMHGPGFFGQLSGHFQAVIPKVRFVRMGYAAGIVDDLNDFYARRPRPWRPANRSSCKPTRKEQLRMQRQERHLSEKVKSRIARLLDAGFSADEIHERLMRESARA